MFSTIKIAAAVAFLAAGASAQSTTAPVVTNNPQGAAYIATLVPTSKSNITGNVLALTSSDKVGVNFQIALTGLPSEGGPFLYHIHDNPIPADGNCTAAGAHVDPYLRGEDPTCDASAPATCQVGDLSGKWGKPTNQTFSANYVDKYVSTVPGTSAFMGNRSIVIHFANKTRIACANFVDYNSPVNSTTSTNGTSSSSNSTSGSSTHSGTSHSGSATSSGSATRSSGASGSASSSAVATGAAAQFLANSGFAVVVGAVAMLVM